MLNVKRFGLAGGIVSGVLVFIISLVALSTGTFASEWLRVVSSIYPGFHPTLVGSLLGLVYGFVHGLVVFGSVAWVYNKLETHVK